MTSQFNYLVGNAQDIGRRQEQQDYLAFSDPGNTAFVSHGGLLGFVADGMGGMACGREASEMAGKTFLRSYEAKAPGQSIPDSLHAALEQANRAVTSIISDRGLNRGEVGTTFAGAVIHDGFLYWIAVGDSRIYLYRGGKLYILNEAHTIGLDLNRRAAKGEISRREAITHLERHVLTSYLGVDPLPLVDASIHPYRLRPEDRIIISSDGLFDVVSNKEIAAIIDHVNHTCGDLQAMSEQLVSTALGKKCSHQDNITVLAMAAGRNQ